MSVHEQLNTVHLTVRHLLYLTKMKSKIKRAQRSVDYEPGIMSGLSRSPPLLSGVGEVRGALRSPTVLQKGDPCARGWPDWVPSQCLHH